MYIYTTFMEPFWINVTIEYGKQGRYLVEYKKVSVREEHFTIKGRNGQLVFSSNRPVLLKKGLKHWKPEYKLIEGRISNIAALDKMVDAIHNVVLHPEKGKALPKDDQASEWKRVPNPRKIKKSGGSTLGDRNKGNFES